MAKLMRAFTLDGFDAVPRLRDDVVVREPDRDQLLIRVHASSVNPSDVYAAMGMLKQWGMEYRFPVTLGHDLAGVVERVGSEVTAYAVGDEVFGFISTESILHDGTYADYAVVPEDRFISAKPRSLDFTHAAVVPLAASTAWFAVGALDVSDGERLLIVGASGGVGSFAVQLAAARGAHVIATALDEDEEYLRDLGASEVIPRDTDIVTAVHERHPDGIEALLDVTNREPARFAALTGALQPGARAASVLQAAVEDSNTRIDGFNIVNRPDPAVLTDLAQRIDANTVQAPVQRTYALSEVSLAFEDLQTQHTEGKLAITMD